MDEVSIKPSKNGILKNSMHAYEPRINPQHVLDDCVRFRKLMGLRNSDPDELQELFVHLISAYIMASSTRKHPNATPEQLKLLERAVDTLMVEWPMRFSYMIFAPRCPEKTIE
jgi:hypothetical protein